MDKILELVEKYGFWSVAGVALIYVAIKVGPKLFELAAKKWEKKEDQKQHVCPAPPPPPSSVFAVFGVDSTNDVWLYAIFLSMAEAESYRDSIKTIAGGNLLLVDEWKIGKPITGLEAYSPYNKKYFPLNASLEKYIDIERLSALEKLRSLSPNQTEPQPDNKSTS